jgi:hypothetical protein
MTMRAAKRGRGRPPIGGKALMAPLSIRFPAPMMEQIEGIAARRLDQPDKASLIRELVAEALEARGRPKL